MAAFTKYGLICIFFLVVGNRVFLSGAHAAEPDRVAHRSTSAPRQMSSEMQYFSTDWMVERYSYKIDNITVLLASIDLNEPVIQDPPAGLNDEPFGLMTYRAPDGQLWGKWRKLEGEIRADERLISECRAAPSRCTSIAAMRMIDISESARGLPLRSKIATINRSLNFEIRYVSDFRQHGVPDVWSAPLATLASGQGDCEDYAIAKYVAFRQLGMNNDDLRLLLVRDRLVGQDHAVLGVRHEAQWLILDNRHSQLVDGSDLPRFVPLFSIDQNGVKVFAAPNVGVGPGQVHTMAIAVSRDYRKSQ